MKATPPDLVLLDMQLPVLDGREFLAELALQSQSDLPVLMLTGAPERCRDLVQAGRRELLSKPFGMDDLQSHVERLLAAHPEQHAASG